MSTILEVNNLSMSYDGKKLALSNCNFALQKGKICAIVGESGSGKSTLLRLIAGLERPNQGSITIDNVVVSDDLKIVAPGKRKVGFVFQNFALFPHLTVEQNITFGLKDNKKATAKDLLQLIQMEGYEHAYPAQLSGGQEQRVALARTLATTPQLLLLDEPFSNLDANLKATLRQEIKTIIKKIGTSMVFITHDIVDAIDIADEIIFLQEGTILEHNSIKDFSQNVENNAVKQLISELKYNTSRILEFLNQ